MVYKKSNLTVLLCPEKQFDQGYGSDEDTTDSAKKTPQPHAQMTQDQPSVFEKMGDSNVYKRTRPFHAVQPRPKLEKWPTHLQLAGRKVHREESAVDLDKQEGEGETLKPFSRGGSSWKHRGTTMGPSTPITHLDPIPDPLAPPLPASIRNRWSRYTAPAHGSRVSQFYLNDFGLKGAQRTDSFSGHQRHRSMASAEMRRQMEEKASRHIRTCQVMGNVKRGCRAQLSYMGLRNTVSPGARYRSPRQQRHEGHQKHFQRDKTFLRAESPTNRNGQLAGMIQVRRNVGTISRIHNVGNFCQDNDPLPEISGRTLILGSGLDI